MNPTTCRSPTTSGHKADPRPAIVVDQLRGWYPATQPSLAEALETGRTHPREPEPDLEAEP